MLPLICNNILLRKFIMKMKYLNFFKGIAFDMNFESILTSPYINIYKSEFTSFFSIFLRISGSILGFYIIFIILNYNFIYFTNIFYYLIFEFFLNFDFFENISLTYSFFIFFLYFFVYHLFFGLRV